MKPNFLELIAVDFLETETLPCLSKKENAINLTPYPAYCPQP